MLCYASVVMLTTIFESLKGLKKMRKTFLTFFPNRMDFTTKKRQVFFSHPPQTQLKMRSTRFSLPVKKLMCSRFSLPDMRASRRAVFIFARGNLKQNGFQQPRFRLPLYFRSSTHLGQKQGRVDCQNDGNQERHQFHEFGAICGKHIAQHFQEIILPDMAGLDVEQI